MSISHRKPHPLSTCGQLDRLTERLTLHCCGPSKCDHDYDGWRETVIDGEVCGGTQICSKCGAAAIDEAHWL